MGLNDVGFNAKPAHINLISNWGGMGDHIARLPAIRYALKNAPHLTLDVYWQDYFVPLARYLMPAHRLTHLPISEAKYSMKGATVDFSPERLTSLSMHLVQHGFLILNDRIGEGEDLYYPQANLVTRDWPENPLPSPFIVFTVAHTAPVRAWPAKEINELARRVKAFGIHPVLVGTDQPLPLGGERGYIKGNIDEGIARDLFFDLTNRTDLLAALGVIQRSVATIGIDNGLLHLAHCTDVPVVAGYTSVEAKYRLPMRPKGQTEVLEAQVGCYGCQSSAHFVNFDFKRCMFSHYDCTKTLTADRFEAALKKLGVL